MFKKLSIVSQFSNVDISTREILPVCSIEPTRVIYFNINVDT